MKKLFYLLICVTLLITACGPTGTATPIVPAASPTIEPPTMTPAPPTETPTPQATETPEGQVPDSGPTDFPAGVDPLTGLTAADPSLLDRRPMVIKVQNLPRNSRPQWGLSLADIVFEYYTEEGTTRFAAIFYGNNAQMVGPIRSARFIDVDIVRGYKAVFAFGSAYQAEMDRLLSSEFANRLVVEGSSTPLFRYEPNGLDYLMVDTANLSSFATNTGMGNVRQNLDGMTFKSAMPAGGQPVNQVYVRYSGAIYNRWDYDPTTGKYLRFSDTEDDPNANNPQYAQLTDRLTGQPIAPDNVVVLFVTHELYSPNIYDILLSGTGDAYAFRDGMAYKVKWQRDNAGVVTMLNLDGTPFPFKPGTTWFEVMGLSSTVQQSGQIIRFQHYMP